MTAKLEQILQNYKKTFSLFDLDDSGIIHPKELVAIFKVLALEETEEDLRRIAQKAEDDYNSELSFRRFLSLVLRRKNTPGIIDPLFDDPPCLEFGDSDIGVPDIKLKLFAERLGVEYSDEEIKEILDAIPYDPPEGAEYWDKTVHLKFEES